MLTSDSAIDADDQISSADMKLADWLGDEPPVWGTWRRIWPRLGFPQYPKRKRTRWRLWSIMIIDHVKVVISKFIQTLKFFNLSWQWNKTFEIIGIPSYTKYRDWCGLSRVHTWQDLQGIMPNKVRIMAEMTIIGMNERMAKLCRYHHFSHFCGNSMLSTNSPMHIADKVFANVTIAFRQLLLTVACMNLPKIW